MSEPERGHVAPSLLHLEEHDAEKEDGAGDDGDHADGAMKARDDGERLGRLDGDVGGAVGPEAERRVVDASERLGGRVRGPGGHGEPVDAVAVAQQLLEVAEVHPDAVLAPGDLGGIGAPLDDAGDDGAVAGLAGRSGERDTVAHAESGVGGEARVYCDGACAVLRARTRNRACALLRRKGAEGEEQQEDDGAKDHGDARRTRADRRAFLAADASLSGPSSPSAPCP
jgi:hypothetical protein